ncbi:MAG TPA: glycosyltransferase [Candidatus Saccharimonadales bacterium]|nr:glycosyltransferase [Candidatus Saccharimonadales bacterium]
MRPLKIAVITCYDQADYVRAKVLRTAFAACPGTGVFIIKNRHKGLLRYFEVPAKILAAKLRQRPDILIITFRGYEMLPFTLLVKGRTPLIFDEFINPGEYLEEHGTLRTNSRGGRLFLRCYGWLLSHCRFVLTDTQAHADFSAELCRLPKAKFRALPVSTDEQVFTPAQPGRRHKELFTVFYYGNAISLMTLHGLQYVLAAAQLLQDEADIHFVLIGGKAEAAHACAQAAAKGAHVTHMPWVPFAELAQLAHDAGVTLGGPFGKTLQSQFVITGKTYQFLAAAAPVIVAKNKVSGVFVDKQNCLLVPPADAQALAKAIRWAKAHPTELRQIGRAGRALYETHFSQAVVNDLVRDMIESI